MFPAQLWQVRLVSDHIKTPVNGNSTPVLSSQIQRNSETEIETETEKNRNRNRKTEIETEKETEIETETEKKLKQKQRNTGHIKTLVNGTSTPVLSSQIQRNRETETEKQK